MASNDTVLIAGVAGHRVEALEQIYRRYSRAVYSLALGVVRNGAVAEELTGEVFLGLWSDPSQFRPDGPDQLQTRLCADCAKRALAWLRHQDAPIQHTRNLSHATVDAAVQSRALSPPLAEMPPDERMAVVMTYFGRQTYRATAALLGEPEGTIRSRLGSGLRRLRVPVAGTGDES